MAGAAGKGMLFVIVAIAGGVGYNFINNSMNYVAVDGTVTGVTRECEYAPGTNTQMDGPKRGDCNLHPDFQAERNNREGAKSHLVGTAKAQVSYMSPIDNVYHTGTLQVDGSDDEFYTLDPNDTVKILASKSDPTIVKLQ